MNGTKPAMTDTLPIRKLRDHPDVQQLTDLTFAEDSEGVLYAATGNDPEEATVFRIDAGAGTIEETPPPDQIPDSSASELGFDPSEMRPVRDVADSRSMPRD